MTSRSGTFRVSKGTIAYVAIIPLVVGVLLMLNPWHSHRYGSFGRPLYGCLFIVVGLVMPVLGRRVSIHVQPDGVTVTQLFGDKTFPRGSTATVKRRMGGRRLDLRSPTGAKAGLLLNSFPRGQRKRLIETVTASLSDDRSEPPRVA